MPKIVLSYRRSDSDAIAGRIRDRLVRDYGEDSVFMDIDSIPFGTDFREHIAAAIRRNDVLLAVVGPNWIGRHAEGPSRIHEELDFVRIEVETAMKAGIPVIPLLVNGAAMPSPEELPPSVKDLAFRNAATVDSGRDFHQHMDRLGRSIERMTGTPPERPHGGAPAVKKRRIGYLIGAVVMALGGGYAGSILLDQFRNSRSAMAIPDPRSIGTPEDLAAALQTIERKKADLSRDQVKSISEELTAKLLPADENVMSRVRRRHMNEKLVATLLRLNDKDLSYVWRRLPSNLDLTDIDLSGANLAGIRFDKTFAIYTRFRDAQLDDAVFHDALIRNSDFAGTSLSETAFPETDWFNAFNFSADRRDGQPMAFTRWMRCPDGYKRDAVQPFTKSMEDWYEVKFKNLSPPDAQNLANQWKDYAKDGGLCDVVQGAQ